jgi:hypothetical protein
MADVITLDPQEETPKELECLNCFANVFYIFPDSIITCASCKHIMELSMFATIYLSPRTGDA